MESHTGIEVQLNLAQQSNVPGNVAFGRESA